MPESNKNREMSFWEHLEELRGCVLRCLAVLFVLFAALFFFKDFIFDGIVLRPARPDFWFYRAFGLNLSLDIINIDIPAQFFTHIKVTFILAIVICFPYICYELWSFVSPGLYSNEKPVVKKAFGLGAGLFYSGLLVGYFLVMPLLLYFFNGYQVSSSIANTFSLHSYISIFLSMVFLMGVLFEYPSVVAVLSFFGVVDRVFLRRYRRHAIVAILLLAAVLTPTGDPFTLLVVSVPLYALYEFSILLCREKKADDLD